MQPLYLNLSSQKRQIKEKPFVVIKTVKIVKISETPGLRKFLRFLIFLFPIRIGILISLFFFFFLQGHKINLSRIGQGHAFAENISVRAAVFGQFG